MFLGNILKQKSLFCVLLLLFCECVYQCIACFKEIVVAYSFAGLFPKLLYRLRYFRFIIKISNLFYNVFLLHVLVNGSPNIILR